MNAIEEVQRLKELRMVVGEHFSVFPTKALSQLDDGELRQLWADVTDYTHSHTLDEITSEYLAEYYFDICEQCEIRNQLAPLDEVLQQATLRIHKKFG